jgi:uncharacterized membrane protein YeaQ/YmgE (transglycosylase-associated protein family)
VGILSWALFGLIAGFIASKVVNQRGEGCFLNIALGLVGALVGGFLYRLVTHEEVIFRFGIKPMFVAIIGAIVVLVVYHAISGRRRLL